MAPPRHATTWRSGPLRFGLARETQNFSSAELLAQIRDFDAAPTARRCTTVLLTARGLAGGAVIIAWHVSPFATSASPSRLRYQPAQPIVHARHTAQEHHDHSELGGRQEETPSTPLITVFKYKHGSAHMFVKTLEEERAHDVEGEFNWDEHIARAARSGARVELYLMVFLDGHKTQRGIFPQRSSSAAIHDRLAKLALEVLFGDEASAQIQIQALLDANEDVLD
ncbi:hypothetical protein B0H17DRAFT_1136996 [Mycena rosella]|uniref:Uncharacterized protein n=1 Tax=Mycena rosella TaxID=1033263 RepID=A0AAD7D9D6_MYCRO|nr:hypothetical protein B0H17DRAFT_1136996 [Mycena rosella]